MAECYPDVVADHSPIPENVENAQDIALAIGEQHANIDFVLGDSRSRGEISGYVTDAAGAPITAIAVSAATNGTRHGRVANFCFGKDSSNGWRRLLPFALFVAKSVCPRLS